MKRKLAIAMSGGVDSSVAAALVKDAGHEVLGVTMRLWGEDGDSESAVASAREVCRLIGIEHKLLDLRETFRKDVIDYFIDTYAAGLTPNPCIRCNEAVKFGVLMKVVDLLRGERLVTGHYARVLLDGKTGRYNLLKAVDESRDQSYFLCRLSQKQLSSAMFPLGEMTKDEVRSIARQKGLPTADRGDSQEVCFVPDDDYRGFIESERPDTVNEGDFIDTEGNVIGRHRGVAFYTVGQRKGLGISSPLGRRYVLSRDPERNVVVLGGEEDLRSPSCHVRGVNWVAFEALHEPIPARVKLRHRSEPVSAMLVPEPPGVRVTFDRPEKGVSPGQSAVFYDGDLVLGGGVIVKE